MVQYQNFLLHLVVSGYRMVIWLPIGMGLKSTDEQLKQALELHKRDRLEEALQLYEAILQQTTPPLQAFLNHHPSGDRKESRKKQSNAKTRIDTLSFRTWTLEQSWVPDGFWVYDTCHRVISQSTNLQSQFH